MRHYQSSPEHVFIPDRRGDGVERLDEELYDAIDYLPVLAQPPIEMRDS